MYGFSFFRTLHFDFGNYRCSWPLATLYNYVRYNDKLLRAFLWSSQNDSI